MKVLVIGGNRFVGYQLVWRLLAEGHEVTTLNRGSRLDGFGTRVERLVADRTTDTFMEALFGRSFDAVVDFAAFSGDDARGLLAAVKPHQIGHYIVISTGQVYLVREDCPRPAREEDYDGPVMSKPADPLDVDDWSYGVRKRDMEDTFVEAWNSHRFPVTRLRIPVVNGERDYHRRLESYFWRLMDGGPILLPDGGLKVVRPVYSGDLVRFICRILGQRQTFGEAYNICQEETPTVADIVSVMAESMGARAQLLSISEPELHAVGLSAKSISPLHSRWTSFLHPEKAKQQYDFQHQPYKIYVDKIVNFYMNQPQSTPPDNYQFRRMELELAAKL